MELTWNELLAQVEPIPFEELRDNYPVGKTMVKKTLIVEGKKPREIFYPEQPPVTIRKWAIAGTTMNRPDWYETLGEIGFTHLYHNRACGMDMDRLAQMGIKVIINYTGEDEASWLTTYTNWHNLPICGGHWLDDAGHEPDITRKGELYENWPHRLEVREKFCRFIRERNKDIQNQPVMEMMNNTATGDFPEGHPGWGLAFSEKTHNLLLVDIYAEGPKRQMIAAMEAAWNKFISVYPHQHQVIIQMIANGNNYWPGYIWTQYNFWKEKMASPQFENPYRGQIGVCWYKQELWMKNEEMQKEIKEVIADVMA